MTTTSMITSLKSIGTLSAWRHSIASFLNLTKYQEGTIQHRVATAIYYDRMDMEAAVRSELTVPNTPIKKRFTLAATLTDMPIWTFSKKGVLLPTVFQQSVLGNDNRNGILTAFKLLIEDLRIVRPDGSVKIDMAKHIAGLDINKIWQYYHRHHVLPNDGIIIEFNLTSEDMKILDTFLPSSSKYPDATFAVYNENGTITKVKLGDRFNLRMSFTVSDLEQ